MKRTPSRHTGLGLRWKKTRMIDGLPYTMKLLHIKCIVGVLIIVASQQRFECHISYSESFVAK